MMLLVRDRRRPMLGLWRIDHCKELGPILIVSEANNVRQFMLYSYLNMERGIDWAWLKSISNF